MTQLDNDIAENDIYMDIRAFFDRIAVLREPYKRALRAILEPVAVSKDLAAIKIENGFPVFDRRDLKADPALPKAYFLDLLSLIETQKPHEAQAILYQVTQQGCFEELMLQALRQAPAMADQPELMRFLLLETIHPLLEVQAAALQDLPCLQNWSWGYCPICGGDPILGLLDAETRGKLLVCGACATRWSFSRHRCCDCGTTGDVSYFSIEGNKCFRVETCDACKHYLKIMDQSYGALNMPPIQIHLTTLHLDLIAREKGFVHRSSTACLPVDARRPLDCKS